MAASLPAFLNLRGFSITNKTVAMLQGGAANRLVCWRPVCSALLPLRCSHCSSCQFHTHSCPGNHTHLVKWPELQRYCRFDHHTCNAQPGSCYQAEWRRAENSLLLSRKSTASNISQPATNLNKNKWEINDLQDGQPLVQSG